MVSIWPTIDNNPGNYKGILEKGYLNPTDCGNSTLIGSKFITVYFKVSHPDALRYVGDNIRSTYHFKGIKVFWLDEADREYTAYDLDNYCYTLMTICKWTLQISGTMQMCSTKEWKQ